VTIENVSRFYLEVRQCEVTSIKDEQENKQAFANIPRFADICTFSASVHANQGFPATIEVHEQLDQGDKS